MTSVGIPVVQYLLSTMTSTRVRFFNSKPSISD